MARIAVNGVHLGVFEAGRGGPPFVFIHGYACDHTAWQPQFDDLSRDHRCVAIDMRGRGESGAVAPYHVVQQADDAAAVMDALGLDPAVVAGHSLGGLVALVLNERHPERVLGVVTGDAPLKAGDPGFARTAARIRETGDIGPVRKLVEMFTAGSLPPAVADHIRAVMLAITPEVAAGMIEEDGAYAPRMAELVRLADRKPFMAIWAERAAGDPAWLRNTTMFVRQEPIAGAGHFFQLEQPAITSALLRAFLDDVARDPRIQGQ